MVPRVAQGKGVGKSFMGTAAYLLHDKRTEQQIEQAVPVADQSSDRVAWTETRNLAVHEPDLAARVMAATAKDADRLKRAHHEAEQAKLPEDERTPYKSSKPGFNSVFHYSLAWHPDEAPTLTREEQTKAAYASLRALGADHLQAMIIAHDDEPQPHVHVLVNRVNPETGAMEKIDSHAKAKLRDWALQYERDRGYILCPERERRALLREQGLPYDHELKENRQQYDAAQLAKRERTEAPQRAQAVEDRQRELDQGLGKDTREMQTSHAQAWKKLSKDHAFRKAEINREADENNGHAARAIGKQFEPEWRALQAEQVDERAKFQEREETLKGKIVNARDAIGHIWKSRGEEEARRNLIGEGFKVLANAGARLDELKRAQASAQNALGRREKDSIAAAIAGIEKGRQASISANLDLYRSEKAHLDFTQAGDRAANRAAWAQRDTDRTAAWRSFAASVRLECDFEDAAAIEEARRRASDEDRRKRRLEKERQQSADPSPAAPPDKSAKAQEKFNQDSERKATPSPAPDVEKDRQQDRGRERERKIDD